MLSPSLQAFAVAGHDAAAIAERDVPTTSVIDLRGVLELAVGRRLLLRIDAATRFRFGIPIDLQNAVVALLRASLAPRADIAATVTASLVRAGRVMPAEEMQHAPFLSTLGRFWDGGVY
jgi:hypothetical protein